MRAEEVSRRHPVRLVQAFDDGDDGDDDVAFQAAGTAARASTPIRQLTSSVTASQLTPIQQPRARAGACADLAASLNASQTLPSSTSSPQVRPSVPTRTGVLSGSNAVPPAPSVSSSHSYRPRDPEVPPASSSGQPVSSSVDRLAALYQQFQALERGSHAPRRGAASKSQGEVTPTPFRKEAPAAPVQLFRQPSRGTASLDRAGAEEENSPCIPPSHSPSTPAQLRQPASKHDEVYFAQPRVGVAKVPGGGSPTRSTPAPLRTTTAALAKTPGSQAAAAPPLFLRVQPARATVVLPSSLSAEGIPGLIHIAVRVWAVLGFFEMRSVEGAPLDEGGVEEVSCYATGPSSPEDAESFLWGLEEYLTFYRADSPGPSAAVLAEVTVLLRNGLWRVLFNAVFYCVTTLDKHRRRRGPLSRKETDVCTGGAEDAYEVVYSSSSGAEGDDASRPSLSREAPVRLVWKHPGESDEERLARCIRDPLPIDSPLRFASASNAWGREADSASMGRDSPQGIKVPSSRCPLEEAYGGRLRTALTITDWYFVLRCLAQVGYRRDAFYLQTPFHASPHELLLALLWLTQQYKMLAVAEYVELNRRYAFLLQYHVNDAFLHGPASSEGVPRPVYTTARERLLYQFSRTSAWPPVSFDENATIAVRLAQLERCLSKGTSAGCPSASGKTFAPTSSSAATLHVRRLMAVRRLLSLSFSRLHQALQRQAEQVSLLGLHSPLDAQLCRKEHHALYEEVTAGLAYVQATQQRLQTAVDSLEKAGSLVAFLLRYEESTISAEEVLLALEEDDATWLSHDDPVEGDANCTEATRARGKPKATEADRWRRAVRRGKLPISQSLPEDASASLARSAASLAQALSTFRATRVKTTLLETWRRLLRRSHVAPQTVPPENLRFLLDGEAQQVQEARVRENMRYRYSLQAALAAELVVLGYQTQQQRHRSRSRSPLRSGDDSALGTASSGAEPRTVGAGVDVEVQAVQVALPPLDLVTNASTAFAQLRSEEAVYGSVTLGSGELQLTEVGQPAVGSTTSARLELERLQAWEEQLDAQLSVPAQTTARVESCKGLLHSLYRQHSLRIATPVAQKPSSQPLASVQ